MRLRLKVKKIDGVWAVDLPTYSMVPGTFLPVVPGKVTQNGVLPSVSGNDPSVRMLSSEVEVPDEIVDMDTGEIDIGAIQRKYAGQRRWDDPSRTIDIKVSSGVD